jgi:hypothetical protein
MYPDMLDDIEQLLRQHSSDVAELLLSVGIEPNGFDLETVAMASTAIPGFFDQLTDLLGISPFDGDTTKDGAAAPERPSPAPNERGTGTKVDAAKLANGFASVLEMLKKRKEGGGSRPAPRPINTPGPETPGDEKKVPMWAWIGGGVVVLLVVILVILKMKK